MFSSGMMVHSRLIWKIHTSAKKVKKRSENGGFQLSPNSREKKCLELGRVGLEKRKKFWTNDMVRHNRKTDILPLPTAPG